MFSTLGYYICIPFAWLVRVLYNLTGSYGVALILFTLVIKLIMLPFQMKSKKSMMRMNRMSGKMQELQKKYANNQAKYAEEMQKLYAEEGVSPMSGCLWSFLPLPILLALYSIIRQPIVYLMNFGGRANGLEVVEAARKLIEGAGIELTANAAYEQIEISTIINANFPEFIAEHSGWFQVDYNFLGLDLTAMPWNAVKGFSLSWEVIGLILIPILAGASQLLMSRVTMKQQPQQEGAAASSTKTMMYMMPLFSVYIAFLMPAALGVYWIAQSVFSLIQEVVLGKFYNKKLEDEENARYEAIQADRQRRQEEAKRLQEQRKQETAKKQSLREKQKAAQQAKAAKAQKAKSSTTEAGRIGDRPYARGRSYRADRYENEN